MNKMMMKSCIPMAMAACVASSATGETSRPERLDEFMIMAYSGPPLEEVTLERYQEVADAGIGILVPGNGSFGLEQNLKALDLAGQVGIQVIPVDMRMIPFALKPNIDLDETVIRQLARDYREHPALWGYLVRDEPDAGMFPTLRAITNILRSEDPAHEPTINLFPNYGTIHQFGVADYATYVRDYLKTVEPKLLAYDSYPLRLNGVTIYDEWFTNLEIVREEALRVRVPFLVFIQSEGIKEGLRVPNRAEILWQANTVLAYGAQGVGWFTYWTPQDPTMGLPHVEGAKAPIAETHNNGMISVDGKRTPMYGYVREANRHLKKVGTGLIGWNNAAVARYEAGKRVVGTSPVATPVGAEANIVIGTFKKDGKIRLVVSNTRCEAPAVFSLALAKGKTEVEVFASIDAAPGGDTGLDWALEPGGSVVLDLK